MKKKALICIICLVMVFSLGALVFAGKNQNNPVNTATEYAQFNSCENCDGEPLLRQVQAREERELLRGENGMFRRLMRQKFGN